MNSHTQINTKLLHDLFEKRKNVTLSDTDKNQVIHLLARGADPLSFSTSTIFAIIHILIRDAHPELLQLFIKKYDISLYGLSKGILSEALRFQQILDDSLHKAAVKIKLSSECTVEEKEKAYLTHNIIKKHYHIPDQSESYLQDKYIKLYNYIVSKIDAAKRKAELSGKQLLILFGEQHDSLFASVTQIITLLVAREFGIEIFTREENQEWGDILDEPVNQYKAAPLVCGNAYWLSNLLTRIFANHLAIKHIPIDQGRTTHGELIAYDTMQPPTVSFTRINNCKGKVGPMNTLQGIQYRNAVMAIELRKRKYQSIFAEVGFAHLYGLYEEEKLADDFEMVMFSSRSL